MKIKNKFIRNILQVILCVSWFFAPFFVHAEVIISEIMYDLDGTDTGREWIEVENKGSGAIDLSTWKLFEANTNHRITALGGASLAPGGFAIIADNTDKFRADNPSYTGLLFDSAFSLGNEGETIILRDENLADIDSVTYASSIGGAGDGTSLQKKDAVFIAAAPTPGSQTIAIATETPIETPDTTDTTAPDTTKKETTSVLEKITTYSTHSNQAVANMAFDEPELVVTSGRSRLGFVGVPLLFESKIKSAKNIPIGNIASNSWSMGDGTRESGQFIAHTYDFPGEYIVILNTSLGGAEAVSKVKVKILEPRISLELVNGEYVHISNLDGNELNLGGWIVETLGSRFIIPPDTLIGPHGSLNLSGNVLKFKSYKEYVRVLNPHGKILASVTVSEIITNNSDPLIILPLGVSVEDIRIRVLAALKTRE